MIRLLSTFLLAGLPAVQAQTTIEAGPLHVTWSAPAGCPRAEEAAVRVRALLGAEIAAVLGHALDVGAMITPLDSGQFRLDLEIREGSDVGTRSLQAETCQEVAQAGALVIALTINPELYEQPPTARSPSASSVSEPAPATPAPGATTQQSESPPRGAGKEIIHEGSVMSAGERSGGLKYGLGLAGVADAGSLPGIVVGPELALRVRGPVVSGELFGTWLPPRRGVVAGYSNIGGAVELLTAGLRGCAVSRWGAWAGGGCVAFELGRLHGESFGAVNDGSGDITWVAPGLGVVGEYRLVRRLSLRAQLDAFFPLDRSEFILENVGPVHSPGAGVGRLSLGVTADFW